MMCDLMLPLRGHTMWSPLLLLLIMGVSEVNSGHSLQYYYTAVSVPEIGLREFVSAGYVDGIEITRYSSDVGRAVPAAPWMEKVEDPEFWERETKNYEVQEKYIKLFLNMEMKRLNQTNGYRIVQVMHGCELRDDGSTRGYARLGYGGKDYLELDSLHSNVTWLTNESQRIAETLNSQEGAAVEQLQVLLQTGCIDQLTKCVGYSKDVLDRRVRPEVKVSDQTVNGVTKLHCQVYGFYPQDLDVNWQKNGIDVSSHEAKHVSPTVTALTRSESPWKYRQRIEKVTPASWITPGWTDHLMKQQRRMDGVFL
uniref:Ig-like domain-containing protein n=1 Tax=Leptobrachium leishanense TaxID=445787 RepID=A0A8C5MMC7_9ANUR